MVTPLPKTSAPAGRALEAEGIDSLEVLATYSREYIAGLHGVGPKVLYILDEALAVVCLQYQKES